MNTKKDSSLGFNLIFFMLLAFSFQSCSPTLARNRSIKDWEKSEWQIVKKDNNENPTWIIYTRKIAGTNFLEYKIKGNINASPKACLAAFKHDLHHHTDESMQKKFPTYDISEETEKSLLTYVIHNEPFPLKDTEMSVRYSFFSNEEGGTEVKWNEAWDECEVDPSKKLNRVETFRGSWIFTPTTKGSCEASNGVSFDPKKMPLWLIEPMVFKFLREGLEGIRETTYQ